MGRVMNSDSIRRLIARELRSGNRLKPCGGCNKARVTKRVTGRDLCVICEKVSGQ